MPIPTEPHWQHPETDGAHRGIRDFGAGRILHEHWRSLCDQGVCDTIHRFEATGSPVISDGEKPSRAYRGHHRGADHRPVGLLRRDLVEWNDNPPRSAVRGSAGSHTRLVARVAEL
jgi:hypothetical protein